MGFWVDDMLIVHTIHIHPGDYFRGQPPTSNQFESVEVWRMVPMANGEPRLSVNVTFYDPVSLVRPVTAVYTFRRNTELEDAGYRMRHWECESNQNTYLVIGKDGRPSTQFRLPGEPGFLDVARRGPEPQPRPAEGSARTGKEPDLRGSAEVAAQRRLRDDQAFNAVAGRAGAGRGAPPRSAPITASACSTTPRKK